MLYLNEASKKSLTDVSGLGEKRIERIFKHRPFTSWKQVEDLKSFGPKVIAKMQSHPMSLSRPTPNIVTGAIHVTDYWGREIVLMTKSVTTTIRSVTNPNKYLAYPLDMKFLDTKLSTFDRTMKKRVGRVEFKYRKWWWVDFDGVRGTDVLKQENSIWNDVVTYSATGFISGHCVLTAAHTLWPLGGRFSRQQMKTMLLDAKKGRAKRRAALGMTWGNVPNDIVINGYNKIIATIEGKLAQEKTDEECRWFQEGFYKVKEKLQEYELKFFWDGKEMNLHPKKIWVENDMALLSTSSKAKPPEIMTIPIVEFSNATKQEISDFIENNPVIIYGFPSVENIPADSPTLMKTKISSSRFENAKVTKNFILLETRNDCYQGLSGSPVFADVDGVMCFIGIQSYALPMKDETMDIDGEEWNVCVAGAQLFHSSMSPEMEKHFRSVEDKKMFPKNFKKGLKRRNRFDESASKKQKTGKQSEM